MKEDRNKRNIHIYGVNCYTTDDTNGKKGFLNVTRKKQKTKETLKIKSKRRTNEVISR